MFLEEIGGLHTRQPLMRQRFIAKRGADFDRVRRFFCTDQLLVSIVRHSFLGFSQAVIRAGMVPVPGY